MNHSTMRKAGEALWAIAFTAVILWGIGVMIRGTPAQASRDSCECRELRAIRLLLQHQLGVTCDERRCLPVPTATPDGSELP
jgi:hypothetical protein